MRKILFLFLLISLSTGVCFAELRNVAISCKAITEQNDVGNTIITGYKYTLHTGIEAEEAIDVDLEELLPRIEKVAWGGSTIYVAIFSDCTLPSQMLKSIIDAVSKNQYMEIILIENGDKSELREHIKEIYKL
jgi:hypothetical protein